MAIEAESFQQLHDERIAECILKTMADPFESIAVNLMQFSTMTSTSIDGTQANTVPAVLGICAHTIFCCKTKRIWLRLVNQTRNTLICVVKDDARMK